MDMQVYDFRPIHDAESVADSVTVGPYLDLTPQPDPDRWGPVYRIESAI